MQNHTPIQNTRKRTHSIRTIKKNIFVWQSQTCLAKRLNKFTKNLFSKNQTKKNKNKSQKHTEVRGITSTTQTPKNQLLNISGQPQ